MANMDYRDPEWLAEKLGIDKNTVYKFLQDGTIPALHLGRKWLISEARLAAWLAEETESQTQARRKAESAAQGLVQRMTNYSPHAQEVIRLAHEEARRYGHDYLGQEHIVLAIAGVSDSKAFRVITRLDVSGEKLREEFESHVPAGSSPPTNRLARSPGARRAMRLAARLAESMGAERVGTEHLLLGILQTGAGQGVDILRAAGIEFQSVRTAIEAKS